MGSIFRDNKILIEELQKGNEKAFTFLFDFYYVDLCNYIYSFTKNQDQAKDIVQNAMFKIWNTRHKIKDRKFGKNYIYKIAYNLFVDEYRKTKKELNYLDEIKKTALDYFVEEDDDNLKKKHDLIAIEIQNLPPKCREAFLLNKKHGLKYKEVAEELNISVKTVELHISKALKRIKKKLEK